MSDPRNRSVEARLSAWFDDEVKRAKVDIERHVRTPSRSRGRAPTGAAVAFGIVLVLVAVVGGSLAIGYRTRSDEARPSSQPASPAAQAPPAAEQPTVGAELDITGWYWDGVPASIAGEEVLRPAAFEAGDYPVGTLVGGWVRAVGTICRNLGGCNAVDLGESMSSGMSVGIGAPSEPMDRGSIAVLRVATEGSTLVWAADPQVDVNDRFSDGIPAHVDGERVIHAEDLPEASEQIGRRDSVLVAGWHWRPVRYCSIALNAERPLFDPCGWTALSATPVHKDAVDLVAGDVAVPDGPVILQVHRNDPRSAECPDVERATCEAAIVVDDVVWAGDEWTETDPRSVDEVTQLLAEAGVVETLTPVPSGEPDSDCQPDAPPMTWHGSGGLVGRVLVFTSVAERERVGAVSDLGYRGRNSEGDMCVVMVDGLGSARWIEWDNVLVQVPHLLTVPEAEVAARVEAVRAALGLE